jgi:hypothetical protein
MAGEDARASNGVAEMSYCRWSSMGFQCDLYCYEDVDGGWTTHVAGLRRIGIPPQPVEPEDYEADDYLDKLDEFVDSFNLWVKAVAACENEPIGLPFDGMSFNDPDLEGFYSRLTELRALGYRFPDEVLEEVVAEIWEERE